MRTLFTAFCSVLTAAAMSGCSMTGTEEPKPESGIYMLDHADHEMNILAMYAGKLPSYHRESGKEYKKRFWEQVSTRRNIYSLRFTSPNRKVAKLPDPQTAIREIDEFFKPEDGINPDPKKLYAVVIDEENIYWDGQEETLRAVYHHLKERYGLTVYQWFSEPLLPRYDIPADGWVLDAYDVPTSEFQGHLEGFMLTGKPVIPCLWASGHFGNYHLYRNFSQLTDFTLERIAICRSLGLPAVLFAVDRKDGGSVAAWYRPAQDPEEQKYRDTVRNALVLPLSRLKKTAYVKTLPVNIRWDGRIAAEVNCRDFSCAGRIEFDNVRNWRISPAGLRPVVKNAKILLNIPAHGEKIQSLELKADYDGKADGIVPGWQDISGRKQICITAGEGFLLKNISVRGTGKYVCKPVSLQYGMTLEHLIRKGVFESSVAKVFCSRADYAPEIGRDGIGVHGVAGASNKVVLTQKILLPGRNGKVEIRAKIRADRKNFAAIVSASARIAGKTAASVSSADKSGGENLLLTVPVAETDREMEVDWTLEVNCGVATAPKAWLKECRMKFLP